MYRTRICIGLYTSLYIDLYIGLYIGLKDLSSFKSPNGFTPYS